ncbi:hypothetical protein [Bradyrhizobium sp. CCBAU 25338]|uniref:hypothetical protein n=1 Tax=Bradyrhizobium sp. CCBAU 25338 TaxID=1641877 RepID=UPI0023035DC1|nr:hypothetical protein [Bradyrhizobium sp. CCBAU 25338]MDA9529260.1 hypothetical protein [Bradyrhizobium sp. CCBAU 25338]
MKATLAANGTSDPEFWPGGHGTFMSWGTFGGGSLVLEISPDNGDTWIQYDGFGSTKPQSFFIFGFTLPPCMLRAKLINATSPSVSFKVARS